MSNHQGRLLSSERKSFPTETVLMVFSLSRVSRKVNMKSTRQAVAMTIMAYCHAVVTADSALKKFTNGSHAAKAIKEPP